MLGWAIVLVLVQLGLQGLLSTIESGVGYNLSARDVPQPPPSKWTARATRAFHNVLETFPVFAAIALALAVTGRTGGQAALGAQLYVAARALYLPLYLLGIPVVRTLVWTASQLGILMMLRVLIAY